VGFVEKWLVETRGVARPRCGEKSEFDDNGDGRPSGNIMEACDGCRGLFQRGGVKKCARCKKRAYCGRACQRKHWKAGHKDECKPAAATTE
jgi:hypothetical protein